MVDIGINAWSTLFFIPRLNLLLLLISRLVNRSGLRISHSKVFSLEHWIECMLELHVYHENTNLMSKMVLKSSNVKIYFLQLCFQQYLCVVDLKNKWYILDHSQGLKCIVVNLTHHSTNGKSLEVKRECSNCWQTISLKSETFWFNIFFCLLVYIQW